MDKNDMERIISTLDGENEKTRFYVYALCDKSNHKPFYIGKGQGGRVWDHEKGEKKEREIIQNKDIDDEEKERMLEDLSEKHKKIEKIKAESEVEKVIIKWGLTEQEAFMAESALINLYNYPEKTLVNEVKGHASKAEKNSSYKSTCAMSDEEFCFNCCKEKVFIEDIKEKCVFVSINRYYDSYADKPLEEKCEMIRETARGCWVIGEKREKPDYLVATYKKRIYGIFKVIEIKKMLDGVPEDKEKEKMYKLPECPEKLRTKEKECITAINKSKNPSNYSSLSSDAKEKYCEFKNEFLKKNAKYENWIKRKYFVCEEKIPEEMMKYTGRLVEKKDGSPLSNGSPLVYNY